MPNTRGWSRAVVRSHGWPALLHELHSIRQPAGGDPPNIFFQLSRQSVELTNLVSPWIIYAPKHIFLKTEIVK